MGYDLRRPGDRTHPRIPLPVSLEIALEQWRSRSDPATVLEWERELGQLTAAAATPHQDLDGARSRW